MNLSGENNRNEKISLEVNKLKRIKIEKIKNWTIGLTLELNA